MDKKVVVLGAGESGTGAAVLAQLKGFDVFVTDSGKIKDKYRGMLTQYDIPYEEENHTMYKILDADEVIISPGISDKSEVVEAVKKKNIPIISEIEFASRYTHAKKVCITGSNGKTTTTSLVYYMMRKAGLNVGLAGNIGSSFALQVAEENYDYYVLEISSFQLDHMYEFKADIAILMNITPDHLDRYDYQLENYVESKFRIIQNLTEEEYFIFCSDDEITMNHIERIVVKAKELPFSQNQEVEEGAFVENGNMHIRVGDSDFSMSLGELSLKGRHNIYNSMAAGIAGNVLNIRKDVIRESLSDFKGVEHRLERYLKIHGIEFINDSKATNVNSAWYALESMTTKVVWIAGGIDKGNAYNDLLDLVKSKVKAIVCMGVDNSKIHVAFDHLGLPMVDVTSMKDAVRSAYYLAKDGDTVLLSPACASFDLFENYEDRGRQFKECVKEL